MTRKKNFSETVLGKVLGGLGKTADGLLTGGKLSGIIDSILGNTQLSEEEKKQALDKLGLILKDKADARAMNVSIQNSKYASWIAKNISSILAIGVLLLFITVNILPMVGSSTISDLSSAGITNVVMVVVTFYFGSSLRKN